MRVGADECVGIRQRRAARRTVDVFGREHHPGEIFEVDLVDDSRVGRDDAEVLESVLAPAQKGVAFAVAGELQLGVRLEGDRGAGLVHLDGMVDHQLNRLEGIDLPGVSSHPLHRVAHRGQIDDRGDAGEILEEHPARSEGDLLRGDGLRVPRAEGLHVVGRDGRSVLVAEQVFEQDFEREREPGKIHADRLQSVEAINLVGVAIDVNRRLGLKRVGHDGSRAWSNSLRPRDESSRGRGVGGFSPNPAAWE